MSNAHYWPAKDGSMLKACTQDDGITLYFRSIKSTEKDEVWSQYLPHCNQISKKSVSGPDNWTPAQARTNYSLSRWGNDAFYAWEFARRQFRLVLLNGVYTAEECIHGTWYPVYISPDCDPIFEGLLKAAKDVAALIAARDVTTP